MIKLKSLLQDAKYVAQKDGASITFDADSDTDAERQAVQMQATRPKEIDYEAKGPMSQEWTYQDAAGRTHKGHMQQFFDHGGTDVTYQFIDKDTGEMSMVSGSRLKAAKRSGMSPMWVKEQGIGFPGVEPGTIPADYPDRKKKVAAARKQADRMRTEADKPSLTAQLKAAKKASRDFDDHYTTVANQDNMHDPHNEFVNDTSFELRQKVIDLEKKLAAQRGKKGLKEAVQFRKGQTVQHFTNPKAQAVVVRYDPPKEYPEYGKGSWNNHSFAGGQGLLTVKFPNGHTETDFEGYWKPTKNEDKVVNEDYKTLRPLRKLIREELRHLLNEAIFWQSSYQGFMVTYSGAPGIGGTATVTKRGVPSDKFDDELGEAYKILGTFKATKPGSTWGSDGIGYIMNKKEGLVNVKKSGVVAKNAKAAFAELGLDV